MSGDRGTLEKLVILAYTTPNYSGDPIGRLEKSFYGLIQNGKKFSRMYFYEDGIYDAGREGLSGFYLTVSRPPLGKKLF